ncbi:hypothetical protein KC19_4G085500 [Ceratodon purpureus]|uniref:Uncharacterized protein n=1 Tax=Ceratodon purpureus TaxID=3225 RepID=A0A8T0I6F0_CERPU|nr:hypothetical protein KC19_4G085500 [Ceratodon purpureus]
MGLVRFEQALDSDKLLLMKSFFLLVMKKIICYLGLDGLFSSTTPTDSLFTEIRDQLFFSHYHVICATSPCINMSYVQLGSFFGRWWVRMTGFDDMLWGSWYWAECL